jgi:arylsulfatase A-like enzyme
MIGSRGIRCVSGGLLAALLLFPGCGSQDRPPQPRASTAVPVKGKRPDVVLVSIDSLRFDHVGCYGYSKPTTPVFDRLAAEGVRFQNAVSSTSWTLPAHASLFTGLYDATHGLVDNGLKLSDNLLTLAVVMKAAGYRTAGFFGGPYLLPSYGLSQGFDTYVGCMSSLEEDGHDPLEERVAAKGEAVRSFRDVTGPRTVEKVTEWLGTLDDRPFFLFLHLWDVHYDYIPPDEYARLFDPDYKGTLTGQHMMSNAAVSPNMPKRDLEHLIALYDGEIRFTDDNLAKILAEIERRGRMQSSLVVVLSDHGEEFFEHGNKGHQKSLYEESVRIPLVFRWPGKLDRGRVVKDQVRITDVMPTIAALAGAPIPAEIQGRDIAPLMRGESLPAEPALCELLVKNRHKLYGVRTNEKMFLTFPTPHFWQFGYQYFDLEKDPGEHNVLPVWSSGLFEARGKLKRLRGDSEALANRLGETVVEGPAMDDEQRERLKSLGYLGGH